MHPGLSNILILVSFMQGGSQGYPIRERTYDAKSGKGVPDLWSMTRRRTLFNFLRYWWKLLGITVYTTRPHICHKNSIGKHKGYPFYAEVQANLKNWQLHPTCIKIRITDYYLKLCSCVLNQSKPKWSLHNIVKWPSPVHCKSESVCWGTRRSKSTQNLNNHINCKSSYVNMH